MVKEEDNSGTGYEDGQYPFVVWFCDIKQMTKLLTFVFSFDHNN